MNIEHLRTFLDVADTGSFHRSADRLNVGQSTVSARIKALEDRLDRILFNRMKNGVTMTGAGQRLWRHADVAVRAWEQGRQTLALPDAMRAACALGIQQALAEWLALEWLSWMQQRHADVAIRIETGYSNLLLRQLDDALLDIAVLFLPQTRPGLTVETLYVDDLVLVATEPRDVASGWLGDYVFVDWSYDFRTDHAKAFPEMELPRLTVPLPNVALNHILARGGSAYLARATVEPWIEDGQLHEVVGAPTFQRPVFLVYRDDPVDAEVQETALAGLRQIASAYT
ncbi:MAG: LysR family transcriptional regulator [Alphaproteobacteria bacterium]|nr:LysR family transcriptional regulator [Alphaproteobacteria bacterium]